jgi:hypothetical protein
MPEPTPTFTVMPDNVSELARERLVHLRRQTGLNDPEILEALLERSQAVDDGPRGLRRMFPNHFGSPAAALWEPSEPFVVGTNVTMPKPPTRLDRFVMYFGFPRLSPATEQFRVTQAFPDPVDAVLS